jgi:hypothetical protein
LLVTKSSAASAWAECVGGDDRVGQVEAVKQ